jgi:hypothetical protein
MPTDNPILRYHFHLVERQRAEIDAQVALLNLSVPLASFDGPPDTRTRPRHHFRRGAISEASGQPNTLAINRQWATAQRDLRIRPPSVSQIERILDSFSGRTQLSDSPAYQRQPSLWRAMADQIRHGRGAQGTPGIQESLSSAAVGLLNLASSIRNRQAMEHNSTAHYRDTHRYGREGWWTVERTHTFNQRPATIAGSSFAVPHDTLNLFQSVDLFAPPPRRATVLEDANRVNIHVGTYCQRLESVFNETVAARRRGADVPKGKLFTTSMELSRVRQLKSILEEEFSLLQQAEREACSRGSSRQNGTRRRHGESRGASSHEQPPYMAAEDESSASEIGEPEGWSNLEFVFDGDYPEEVCFRVGSQELKYPIEEVESWMVDSRGHERRAQTRKNPGRDTLAERWRESQPAHRMLHTLAMPPTATSRWLNDEASIHDYFQTSRNQRSYDPSEAADEDYYRSYNGGESVLQDTEHEEEDDEEDNGGEADDLDHEGWSDPIPQALQAVESSEPRAGADAPIAGARFQAPIDLTNSPSTAGSQARSQNTGDESNRGTAASWEPEDEREPDPPHPILGWTSHHSLFMFSCRGNIFDVTRQLQHAFGFEPALSSHLVGERLNGQFAARHRGFVLAFLPGEEGTNMRASRRDFLHQRSLANDDVYYGTQNVAEGDVQRADYAAPPLPGLVPACWNRTLDACLLLDLNRGRFNFLNFWYRRREMLGGNFLFQELQEFLAIRLAQVRYLGVTEAELEAVQEIGSRGQVD